MKIQISTSGIGATVFLRRLKECLRMHYPVEFVKNKPDIYLSSGWLGNRPKGARHIHRADGVYFDTLLSGKTGMNKRIARAIKKAHGVIYQSNYSKKICENILKIKKREYTIIYNGSITTEQTIDIKNYDKILMSCAKWRPLKRPKSIAKGFLKADIKNSLLIMAGKINKEDKIIHPNIKYLGELNPNELLKYYKSCNAIIHISKFDACPNVVVEALVASKPVLCNNVGGTPEIVKDDGIIINIDKPYNYKMFAMKNPDNVKPQKIANGIHELFSKTWNIYRDDLHLDSTARLYYKYFGHILEVV